MHCNASCQLFFAIPLLRRRVVEDDGCVWGVDDDDDANVDVNKEEPVGHFDDDADVLRIPPIVVIFLSIIFDVRVMVVSPPPITASLHSSLCKDSSELSEARRDGSEEDEANNLTFSFPTPLLWRRINN